MSINNKEKLKSFLDVSEIKKLENENPEKFKILSDKIHLLTDTQKEIADLKKELNGTLEEKVDKLLGFIESEEKNQKPTKQETDKAKKEAEEKGFSWEKITKLVEEKGGWFSWAGFFAGIGAVFSGLFSNMFKGLDKKVDEVADYLEEKVDGLTSGVTKESKGEFKNNEYISHNKKFNIKFKSKEVIDTIKINGKKYQLDGKFKLEEKNGEYYLVSTTLGIESKYNLDYIGYVIDNKNFSNNFSDISISQNDVGEYFNVIPDNWEVWNTDLVFISNEFLAKAEKNIINVGDTKIEFDKNIDSNLVDGIEIKNLEISGIKYSIEPKGTKFDLSKKGLSYLLEDKILMTFGQDEIKLKDISKVIKEENKTEKGYILLNKNIGGTKNRIYLKEIN